LEQVRKLKGDEVLLLYSDLGTPTNLAITKYVNGKKDRVRRDGIQGLQAVCVVYGISASHAG
jgi:hypothetical protein